MLTSMRRLSLVVVICFLLVGVPAAKLTECDGSVDKLEPQSFLELDMRQNATSLSLKLDQDFSHGLKADWNSFMSSINDIAVGWIPVIGQIHSMLKVVLAYVRQIAGYANQHPTLCETGLGLILTGLRRSIKAAKALIIPDAASSTISSLAQVKKVKEEVKQAHRGALSREEQVPPQMVEHLFSKEVQDKVKQGNAHFYSRMASKFKIQAKMLKEEVKHLIDVPNKEEASKYRTKFLAELETVDTLKLEAAVLAIVIRSLLQRFEMTETAQKLQSLIQENMEPGFKLEDIPGAVFVGKMVNVALASSVLGLDAYNPLVKACSAAALAEIRSFFENDNHEMVLEEGIKAQASEEDLTEADEDRAEDAENSEPVQSMEDVGIKPDLNETDVEAL